jgi:hypothetical protein
VGDPSAGNADQSSNDGVDQTEDRLFPRVLRSYSCNDKHDGSRNARYDDVLRSTYRIQDNGPDCNQRHHSPKTKRKNQQIHQTENETEERRRCPRQRCIRALFVTSAEDEDRGDDCPHAPEEFVVPGNKARNSQKKSDCLVAQQTA